MTAQRRQGSQTWGQLGLRRSDFQTLWTLGHVEIDYHLSSNRGMAVNTIEELCSTLGSVPKRSMCLKRLTTLTWLINVV